MDIHKITVSNELRETLIEIDCWAVKKNEVENLARLVFGGALAPPLRSKNMRAIIAGNKMGSAATFLTDEFEALAKQCAVMIALGNEYVLHAAAFFHLRFENIHPLVDCNGRVGRLLLSEQIRRTFAVELDATLNFFHASQCDYRAVFAAGSDSESFTLLTKLLAKHAKAENVSKRVLPYPLSPSFPDKRAAAEWVKQNLSEGISTAALKPRANPTVLSKALKDLF